MSITKKINYVIIFLQFVVLFAFGIFIISNWNYISNPYQIPNYHVSGSIFEYQNEKLARFKTFGFEYPCRIILYLTFFQTILLGFLILRKEFEKYGKEIILLSILLLPIFIFEDLFLASFYAVFILLIVSLILWFYKRFKNFRPFLIINIITVVIWTIFLFSYMELFFD